MDVHVASDPDDPATGSRRRLPAVRGRTYLALLAALLVIGSLLGGLAVAALRFQRDQTGLIAPTSSAPASAGPTEVRGQTSEPSAAGSSATPSSTTGVTPAPTAGASPGPVVPLVAGGGAMVVSDRVRVRSSPGVGEGSLLLEPLLAIGDRTVVVAGPVEADGYQWYFVRPHGRGDAELPSGWVAHAGKDGEQWLAPALVPDSIAVTVDDRIRVRSAPGVGEDSKPLEPLLDRREYLLVLDGPVEADGYTWYEVLSPGVQNNCWPATGVPRLLLFNADLLPLCPRMLGGWVASASKDGAPWLVPGRVHCPEPSPSGATTLAEVTSKQGYALAIVCFGDTTLTFPATRHLRCGGGRAAWPMEPDWLNDSGIVEVLQDGGRDLFAAPHPDGLAVADCNGQDGRYRIQGHFDDQEARSCRIRLDFSADAPEFDHRTSEYWCRTTFVVTHRDPSETAGPTTPAGPPNDTPPGITITSLPFTHSTDTSQAQIHADEPNSTCTQLGGQSVWYNLAASADMNLVADTFGSAYDTVIDVFEGTLTTDRFNPGFEGLTVVACNDNSGGSRQSEIAFAIVAGQDYVIRVSVPLEAIGGALAFHLSAVEQ